MLLCTPSTQYTVRETNNWIFVDAPKNSENFKGQPLSFFLSSIIKDKATGRSKSGRTKFVQECKSLKRWKALVERIQDGSQANVQVPAPWAGKKGEPIVAKARLTTGNSLSDPWLLALKSAINYSSYHGTTLMPACPFNVGSDDGPRNTTQVMDFNLQQ